MGFKDMINLSSSLPSARRVRHTHPLITADEPILAPSHPSQDYQPWCLVIFPALLACWGNIGLVGFVDEDEGGPLHNRSAGADKGDMDVFDLAFRSPS